MNEFNVEPATWLEFSEDFEPILRIDLTDEIIGRIKMLIARGKLKSGSRLPPERDFARMLGVGRPALRQALKALATIGIIESRVGQGTFVSVSTSRFLNAPMDFMLLLDAVAPMELFEVRKLIEVELAGLAAKRALEEEIELMGAVLRRQEVNLDKPLDFLAEDLNFHSAISKAAHNVLFIAILESLRHLMSESMHKLLLTEKDLSLSLHFHQRIFREINARNERGAREAMFDHLDQVFHHWQDTQ